MVKCPLYSGAFTAAESTSKENRHRGLWFDKFATAPLPQGQNDSKTQEWKTKWLNKVAGSAGDRNLLEEAAKRQAKMIHQRGGRVLCFENTSPLATGLGRPHRVENGFAWHHSFGVPYLAGSGLKGVTRAWWCEENDVLQDQCVSPWFGTCENVGDFIFLDLLPRGPVNLVVDVMTPHYSDYYQDKKTPGDWINPVPIPFLTAGAGGHWQTGILPRKPSENTEQELDALVNTITDAVLWGIGAKTAVGYGSLTRDLEREEKDQRQRAAEAQRNREEKAKEAELAKLSPERRDLQQRIESEGWTVDLQNFVNGCTQYLDQVETPDQECVQYICDDLLPAVNPSYKNGWQNPQKVKGKKKKSVYPPSLIPVLQRLKELRES